MTNVFRLQGAGINWALTNQPGPRGQKHLMEAECIINAGPSSFVKRVREPEENLICNADDNNLWPCQEIFFPAPLVQLRASAVTSSYT